MRLSDCHSFHDFRRMAQARLPGPIFDYIDGAADDEVTYRRTPPRSRPANSFPTSCVAWARSTCP